MSSSKLTMRILTALTQVRLVVEGGIHGKVPFVIAVQTSEEEHHPWFVCLDPLPGFTKKALAQSAEKALNPGASVVSDG